MKLQLYECNRCGYTAVTDPVPPSWGPYCPVDTRHGRMSEPNAERDDWDKPIA